MPEPAQFELHVVDQVQRSCCSTRWISTPSSFTIASCAVEPMLVPVAPTPILRSLSPASADSSVNAWLSPVAPFRISREPPPSLTMLAVTPAFFGVDRRGDAVEAGVVAVDRDRDRRAAARGEAGHRAARDGRAAEGQREAAGADRGGAVGDDRRSRPTAAWRAGSLRCWRRATTRSCRAGSVTFSTFALLLVGLVASEPPFTRLVSADEKPVIALFRLATPEICAVTVSVLAVSCLFLARIARRPAP